MPKAVPPSVITIAVDAGLAAQYRDAYTRAFGSGKTENLPLDKFIARFVEDRLSEELAFAEEDSPPVRR